MLAMEIQTVWLCNCCIHLAVAHTYIQHFFNLASSLTTGTQQSYVISADTHRSMVVWLMTLRKQESHMHVSRARQILQCQALMQVVGRGTN
jgi:hypothetical protein